MASTAAGPSSASPTIRRSGRRAAWACSNSRAGSSSSTIKVFRKEASGMVEGQCGLQLLLGDANRNLEAARVEVALLDGESRAVQVFQAPAQNGKPITFAILQCGRFAANRPGIADGGLQQGRDRSNEDIH